ncbi:MAG: hypothetical protein J6V72_12085 [Kiritimatiellae bacterium]|nr:hypothetical protein [Kiritimatiellia bacterium]
MLTFLCVYLAISLLVGLAASVGFLYECKPCMYRWWRTLMRVCPLSWLAVAAFFIAYGFYKRHEIQKGGAPC